jgi:hypothetical protein
MNDLDTLRLQRLIEKTVEQSISDALLFDGGRDLIRKIVREALRDLLPAALREAMPR